MLLHARVRRALGFLAVTALGTLPGFRAAHAQDNAAQALALYGSGGGSSFTRRCGDAQVLTGIRVRAGAVIDALGVRCRPVNANGTLGSEVNVGTLAGGTGGTASFGSCPDGSVVSGQAGVGSIATPISLLDLRCRRWDPATRSFTGSLTGVIHVITGAGAAVVAVNTLYNQNLPTSDCSRRTQPVVLLRGRAGLIIDAAGFTCDEP